MAELTAKIPRPQMRGLLHSQTKRTFLWVGLSVLTAGLYMKFIFGDGAKQKYADFYKTYDIEKEFERMRKKGLFDSCDQDD